MKRLYVFDALHAGSRTRYEAEAGHLDGAAEAIVEYRRRGDVQTDTLELVRILRVPGRDPAPRPVVREVEA